MRKPGQQEPCSHDGCEGICTFVTWISTSSGVGEDGAMTNPVTHEEWQCSIDSSHNYCENEPHPTHPMAWEEWPTATEAAVAKSTKA